MSCQILNNGVMNNITDLIGSKQATVRKVLPKSQKNGTGT